MGRVIKGSGKSGQKKKGGARMKRTTIKTNIQVIIIPVKINPWAVWEKKSRNYTGLGGGRFSGD